MNPLLRLGLDLGPLVIFLAVSSRFGVLAATAVFMVLSVLALGVHWWGERRVPPLLVLSTALVLVFGGLTLVLADETFIKIKPTILYLLFASILGVGLSRGEVLIKQAFTGAIDLDDGAWRTLTWRFIGFFVVMACANEVVWRTQTTEVWAAVKIGFWLAVIAFTMAQTPFLLKHNRMPEAPGDGG